MSLRVFIYKVNIFDLPIKHEDHLDSWYRIIFRPPVNLTNAVSKVLQPSSIADTATPGISFPYDQHLKTRVDHPTRQKKNHANHTTFCLVRISSFRESTFRKRSSPAC